MRESDKVGKYSGIKKSKVNWFWYPYIPFGKITLIQGDPSEGKSMLALKLASIASRAGTMPDGTVLSTPIRVIYQCLEDGISDTIIPRLEQAGGKISNFFFIKDNENPAGSLDRESIEQVIEKTHAKILIIDPIQIALGKSFYTGEFGAVRNYMDMLAAIANQTGCAIILIGHLNKNESGKELYRGCGSVDIVAAARSILRVERIKEGSSVRIIRHDSIVPREVYDAARRMQAYMRFTKGKRALPVLSVVDEGVLKGYVPIHKDWTGFSGDEYRAASESVKPDKKRSPQQNKKVIDLSGYQRVSASLFSSSDKPVLTITNGRMRFNAACVKKFQNVEYVELLLNSVNNRIAIRPCDKDNPNAIRWARLKNEKWVAYPLACKGLFGALVDIVNWSDDSIYKLYGQFIEDGKQKMLLFSLDEPDITKTQEQVVVPDKPDEDPDCETEQSDNSKDEIVVIEKVRVFPDVWDGSFGMSVPSIVSGVALKRVHYSGDWDVLRPAKEIEGMNFITTEQLQDLMSEAEQIMEGWAINEAS